MSSQAQRRRGTSGSRGASVRATGWGWRHAGRHAWAVSHLDLHIEPGERVLLLGASGSGKSTLVHALAGVLGTDEGEQRGTLLIDGGDPRGSRGRAGLVLQDPDSQVILARVGDDVAFGCENLGVPREETWRRVQAALDMVGLALPLSRPTSNLSGGQKQRLALAGVLAMQPGLILLDEPTANLDPDGVAEVRDAVANVLDATGATLIVIEHRVAVWQDLVDRVIVLDPAGGVLADGHPTTVLAEHGAALAEVGVWVPGVEHRMSSRRRVAVNHPLVRADAISIARSRTVQVATDIEVTVRSGEVLAITGPNGSGKSTLALTLAGLLRPHTGRVVASDTLAAGASNSPADWKSRQLLPRIGMVFQDSEHQFLTGSVRAELAVGPRALRLGQQEIDRRVDMLLARLRLAGLAEANPFTLSGGEKRRLSVATVLASQPRMLVLDEPTFGQDFRTWQGIVALMAELADEGAGIVAVSHDREMIDALADREYVLAPAANAARNGTGIR